MDLIYQILQKGINLEASDIHLVPGQLPVYRVNRKLFFDESKLILSGEMLTSLVEFFCNQTPGLKEEIDSKRQADFSYGYGGHRFRINVAMTQCNPAFSIRIIPNGDIKVDDMGLAPVLQKLRKIDSGLILITGKVNSGKSTTMNAFIQEVNKVSNKKIVTLEDPIEYVHESNKSIIIQREVGAASDVLSYYDGLINLLREDADIAVVGEIRDRKTMDVALDLAESGGLVIGTLHTRSCGETLDRILNLYDPADQVTVKNTVSSVLKIVISQKLVVSTEDKLLMVPEIMVVNSSIAAHIRQEKFNISDIEDAIHSQRESGSISFELSFVDLYLKGLVDMQTIKDNIDPNRLDVVKSNIINSGGKID